MLFLIGGGKREMGDEKYQKVLIYPFHVYGYTKSGGIGKNGPNTPPAPLYEKYHTFYIFSLRL